jgi:hypothetical protein
VALASVFFPPFQKRTRVMGTTLESERTLANERFKDGDFAVALEVTRSLHIQTSPPPLDLAE